MLRDDDSLSKEGAAFDSADIKSVTKLSQGRKSHIIFRAGKGIRQPCTIHIERNAEIMTNPADVLQFLPGIERSEFCRLGKIDKARHDHMIPVFILLPGGKAGSDDLA